MQLRVVRDLGDSESPEPIINELITTIEVATQAGRNFLDENQFDKGLYSIGMPYRKWLRSSDIVFISDAELGQSFYARVTNCNVTITVAGDKVIFDQSIDVERSIL